MSEQEIKRSADAVVELYCFKELVDFDPLRQRTQKRVDIINASILRKRICSAITHTEGQIEMIEQCLADWEDSIIWHEKKAILKELEDRI